MCHGGGQLHTLITDLCWARSHPDVSWDLWPKPDFSELNELRDREAKPDRTLPTSHGEPVCVSEGFGLACLLYFIAGREMENLLLYKSYHPQHK